MSPPPSTSPAPVEIVAGYTPGLIGRSIAPMVEYCAPISGFGAAFEAFMARELAQLVARMHEPGNPFRNQAWAAVQGGAIVGTVFLETHAPGSRVGHLRSFIVDGRVRGAGAGQRLLSALTQYADAIGLDEVQLWTFKELTAARRAYERAGFVFAEERTGEMWGASVQEQRLVRKRPGGGGEE